MFEIKWAFPSNKPLFTQICSNSLSQIDTDPFCYEGVINSQYNIVFTATHMCSHEHRVVVLDLIIYLSSGSLDISLAYLAYHNSSS